MNKYNSSIFVVLLHALFPKIDESVSLFGRVRDTPVGIDLVLWGISRVVSVGEANVHRKGRVSHELGPTGHDGIPVGVRMRVGPDFFFALAEQPNGLLGLGSTLFVKQISYLGRLIVENIPIDAPAAQELE